MARPKAPSQETLLNRPARRKAPPAQRKAAADPAALQRAAQSPQQASPADVLALGQAYGNRAVSRALADAAPPPPVQRQAEGAGFEAPDGFADRLEARRGQGQALPDATRGFMEERFSADFGGVRVHTDQEAGDLAQSVQAKAFTHGADIYMGTGQYNPASSDGRRLLAHELTHTLQQGSARLSRRAVIQRKELNANEIVSGLETIPFIKARLDEKLNLGRGEKRDTEADPIRTQVAAVLAQYETNLKGSDKTTNHAMMLAAVLEAVARAVAVNKLNDPALTPLLAVKLLELYRTEITGSLNEMDNAGDALHLAQALLADDPVALFMHGELHLQEAAHRVRQMAFIAGKDPASMFKLLRQKFEIQMATLSKTGVEKSKDKSDTYSVREATGEISSEYFGRLFATDTPKWVDSTGGKQLDFTPESAQRLTDLHDLVVNPKAPGSTTVNERAGLTFKQSKHLQEIEEKEAGLDKGGLDTRVDAALAAMFKLDTTGAGKLRAQIKQHLADLPLTVTVSGMGWFGKRAPRRKHGEAEYRAGSSRRQHASYAELFEKEGAQGEVSYLGEYEDPVTSKQKRGKNYLRFRNWKDNVMMGGLGMSDQELPVFGAANINWAAFSSQGTDQANYGVNAYGDTHFVLRKANLANRIVFTATDHGFPRRDIYLAFADFLLGGMGITGLKDVGRANIVKHVVNSLLVGKPVSASTQPFEVQIFGRLNIATDVQEIVVAPTVSDKVKSNIRKFGNKTGIAVNFLAQPTVAVRSEGWFVPMPGDKGDNLVEQVKDKL